MKKVLFAIAAFAALPVLAQKDVSVRYAKDITPATLKAKLSVIASAEMEGRETATPGQKRAAAYIEKHFRSIGLLPGTAGGFQTHYPVYQDTLMNASLIVNGKKFTLGQAFGVNLRTVSTGELNIGEIIFVGAGSTDSTRDDYKDLDVKGKWVMLDDGSATQSSRTQALKLQQARAKGAKGIIVVLKDFPLNTMTLKGNMYLNKPSTANNFPVFPVSYDVASAILNQSVTSSNEILQAKKGSYKTNIVFSTYKRAIMLESSNVIGILPGTDKKDEYVVLTAHYDHIGRRGDVINYGADDDGSGTTAVLQMAEAFAKAKSEGHGPRRSIVFMTVSGEEKGLLGSEFYSENPVFPLAKTSVNLNTDMIGRIDPERKETDSTNYLYIIGDDKLSTELKGITDSVNSKYINLNLDRRFNANDPNRYYYRSDHYNFARKGVPIIFYFSGTHADYHQPTDTVDKINFDVMSKRANLIFHTAWVMANRDEMLKRDIPLK